MQFIISTAKYRILSHKKDIMKHFTIHEEKNIDARIQSDLEKITSILHQNFHDEILDLILVGGFGRGEGSVCIENGAHKPVNDYDIVLIVNSDLKSDKVKEISAHIAQKIGIRLIDLISIKKAGLSRLPYTMFNYDLKYGGYVFQGDTNVLTQIPEMEPAKMPLIEGKTLLFNRLICLLECYSEDFRQREPTMEEKFFLANQCSKAILACCDALLLLKGKYHHSYREKNKRLAEEYARQPEIVDMVKQSTDFKLKPTRDINLDIIEHWFKVKKIYMNIFFLYLNKLYVYGDPFSDWKDFGTFYGNMELNSPKSNLELSEIYLLVAIEKDRKDNHFLELAKEKMKNINGIENTQYLWEEARKECVDLWFKINH